MYIFNSMLGLIDKARAAPTYSQFCYSFYELSVIINRPDFIANHKVFSEFFYKSSLPGEVDHLDTNRPNESTLNELARKFMLAYPNTIDRKRNDHKHIRESLDRHLGVLENSLKFMLNVLTDPERIRIYYRYYDGKYLVIDDVCYLYRKIKDYYYCAAVNLRRNDDIFTSELRATEKWPVNLRPLFNYLYPELSI